LLGIQILILVYLFIVPIVVCVVCCRNDTLAFADY
jgi:hypothetical protein